MTSGIHAGQPILAFRLKSPEYGWVGDIFHMTQAKADLVNRDIPKHSKMRWTVWH